MEQVQTSTKSGRNWKKILLGCGGGCLVLIVLAVAVSWWAYNWVARPGQQVATQRVFDERSQAIFHLSNPEDAPRASAFIGMLLEELRTSNRAAQTENLPASLRFLAEWRRSQQQQQNALTLIPTEISVAVEEDAVGSDFQAVWVINLPRFPRLIRFFMSISGEGLQSYADFDYRDFGSGDGTLAFVHDTLVWARDRENVFLVLDRFAETTPVQPTGWLNDTYRSLEDRHDLLGVIDNRKGVLRWLTTKENGQQRLDVPVLKRRDWERVQQMSLGVDVLTEESLAGRFRLEFSSHEEARRQAEKMREDLQETADIARDAGMQLEFQVDAEPPAVVVTLEASGIREAVSRALLN